MPRLLMPIAATAIAIAAAAAAQHIQADPTDVPAGAYVLDKSHAKLNWGVSHFGFATYTGEFTSFGATLKLDPKDPAKSSLEVVLDVGSVETNDDKLDDILRSDAFFDAKVHPKATFRSTRVEAAGSRNAKVTGLLTLHGITRPVTLDVTFNGAGVNPASKIYTVGFSAKGAIDRSDFGISTYSPGVGETVSLSIDGEFNPSGAAR